MEPMLAHNKDYNLAHLQFPLIASFKIDGIRALVKDGALLSRSFKLIKNEYVQALFKNLPHGTDGELVEGLPYGEGVMQRTSSAVMSRSGRPNVKYYVFDNFAMDAPFSLRWQSISHLSEFIDVVVIEQRLVKNLEELLAYEQEALTLGYEGLIIRSPSGLYKWGRSTFRECYMLKLKRFKDAEAKVLSYYEEMINENVATKNAHGRTERSSHKDNLKPAGTLGGFEVIGINGEFDGVQFRCGGGALTDADRAKFWSQRDSLIGKIITYKYFPIGVKDKPRFPGFKAFRDKRDM